MNKTILRPAIAMIELIFAIVIMGIVLMSAPKLISTATKSGYVAIQQEAINEAASQVNMIMGYHWDESDTDEDYIPPILAVTGGDGNLSESGTTGRRSGTPEESYRSFLRSDGQRFTASSTLGSEAGDEDDMDDFSGTTNLVEIEASGADYIEKATEIDIATTIIYNDDTATYNQANIDFDPFTTTAGITNIKQVTAILTSTSGVDELKKEITLHAFSCNIGGYKLEERDF